METILMSTKERARWEVFSRVKAGEMTLVKASDMLGLSYRQTKRSWSRYQEEGGAGLVHRLRGKASNRRPDVSRKAKALELYAEKYADYGPTLAAECLAAEDSLQVPVQTLRRWLMAAGLWMRKRRRKLHRRRRPRKEQFGELLQMDGSIHDWFEGRRAQAVLMVMVDDATGSVFARFFEQETLAAAWQTFRGWVDRQGIPRALYVDRHSIYRSDREPTAEELLANQEPPTQFGRSMQDLNVRLIKAWSPQAKGRVERMNGTLQDRLVKTLRRANLCDLEAANRFLEEEFLASLNERFSIPAAKRGDLHQTVAETIDLDRVFAVQEERVVQNDWTVRWRNRFLQLPRSTAESIQPGTLVMVCEQLDGRQRVFCGEEELAWSPTRSEPSHRKPATKGTGEIRSSQGQKPAADHPWRQPIVQPPTPSAARPPCPPCSTSVATLPARSKAGRAGGKKEVPT